MRGVATGQADSPPYQLSSRGATSLVEPNTPTGPRPSEPSGTAARQPLPPLPSSPLSPQPPQEAADALAWSDRRREWLDSYWNILNSEQRHLESEVRNHMRNAPNMNWIRNFEHSDRTILFSVLVVAISELYTDNALFRTTLDEYINARPDAAEIGLFLNPHSRWVEVPLFGEMLEKDKRGLEQVILDVLFQIRAWRARRRWLMAEMDLGRHAVAGWRGFETVR